MYRAGESRRFTSSGTWFTLIQLFYSTSFCEHLYRRFSSPLRCLCFCILRGLRAVWSFAHFLSFTFSLVRLYISRLHNFIRMVYDWRQHSLDSGALYGCSALLPDALALRLAGFYMGLFWEWSLAMFGGGDCMIVWVVLWRLFPPGGMSAPHGALDENHDGNMGIDMAEVNFQGGEKNFDLEWNWDWILILSTSMIKQ